jgi:hydrogenase maturation protease
VNKTLIIGLGNPIVSDDSVGIKAARKLKPHFQDNEQVEVIELYSGGLKLMEAMEGFKKAIIIDSMVTGNHTPGTIIEIELDELPRTKNMASAHDTGLYQAMETGRALGIKLPETVNIIGIEALDVINFGENLSPEVEAALPKAVSMAIVRVGQAIGASDG